jgi:aminoglycoside phosphotransferase (APT) family kinase protein
MDRTTFARHLAENPIGGESDIAGWTEISDGWESVMFVVTLGSGDRWVVRSFAPERGDTARREFLGLGLLSEAGYPVPDVLRLVLEEAPFMLMEFIDGREMWLVIADTADRFDLVDTFVGLHRELHALDPTPFAALDEGAFEAPLEYELGTWERIRCSTGS